MEEFMTTINEWLVNLLDNTIFGFFNVLYQLGINIWNWAMMLVGAVATTTPAAFSGSAWNYVVNDALDFTMAIGGSLLNVFYMIGIIRQSTNLKENYTLEIFVDNVIKMLLANMLILHGLDFIKIIFELASISSGAFLLNDLPSVKQIDIDTGKVLFNFFFGWIFLAVSIVCAFTIFLTLYGRYLNLYLLVATYPIAMSTLPGGSGVYNTASSWTRAFLGKSFEIVVIALAVSIGSYMCVEIDFGSVQSGIGAQFDGAIQTIQSMATMVIMTGAVKGVDVFMKRVFGL